MKEVDLIIRNAMGLHVRSASKLAKAATRFKSQVFISYDGLEVNAKSIMGVMMLAAEEGALIKVRADGEDEGDAIAALKALVESKFGGEA